MLDTERTDLPMSLTITADEADSFMKELDAAITAVQRIAMASGREGVLVTRKGCRSFMIELTPEVPYGMTREVSRW
jgi:hypothetical protein